MNDAWLMWTAALTWDMFHSADPVRRRVAAQTLGRIQGMHMARWITRRLGWRDSV